VNDPVITGSVDLAIALKLMQTLELAAWIRRDHFPADALTHHGGKTRDVSIHLHDAGHIASAWGIADMRSTCLSFGRERAAVRMCCFLGLPQRVIEVLHRLRMCVADAWC
jgi:hypothetical protein